ncbi:MAG: hypothetical protein JSU73_08650 [candidate division WOR-3 bacterium]|nr:MAG: hypothetical protein JSU73_08650 [candidate division WOR-3 bacterium]
MRSTAVLSGLALLVSLATAWPRLESSYTIDARIDEDAGVISGTATVALRNAGPDTLERLYLHSGSQAFRSRQRGWTENVQTATRSRQGNGAAFTIEAPSVAVRGAGIPAFEVARDDGRFMLAWPLGPGDSITLVFDFLTPVPAFFATGSPGRYWLCTDWYPRIALEPADFEPTRFVPQTTRGGFGNYTVRLTVPRDLAVLGTGELVEGDEELKWMTWRPDFREFYDRTLASEKTLEFRALGVAGFAFVAGPDLMLRKAETDPRVMVLARSYAGAWDKLADQAASILELYEGWYGPLPFGTAVVVEASGIAPGDAVMPGICVVAQPPITYTRLLESRLARLMAGLWFSGGVVPGNGHWLADGPAVLSEIRYMEERHGRGNLLDLPFYLLPLGQEYYHDVMYYMGQTNRLLTPLDSAPREFVRGTINVAEARFSQAGGFFKMLRRHAGAAVYDSAVRAYLEQNRGQPVRRDALETALSNAGAGDMGWMFDRWLGNRGTCDYSVHGTRRDRADIVVRVRRDGEIPMPVEVELQFADGSSELVTWDSPERNGELRVTSPKRLRRVELDPGYKLLESDRWDNHWPRRVTVHPIVALPSLDAYQLFFGPVFFWDTYHGFQLGAWAQGRQFLDEGPLHGRHTWSSSVHYNTRLRTWQPGLWYQTPVSFISDRLRFSTELAYSADVSKAFGKLSMGLSPVFKQSGAEAVLEYRYLDTRTQRGRDSLAWEPARTAETKVDVNHYYRTPRFLGDQRFYVGAARKELGSGFNYLKASIEERHTFRITRNSSVTVRGFAGAVPGDAPKQQQFFLSGGLKATSAEPMSLGYQGWSSSQENWHYDGDANCRAWAGEYLRGQYAYGINVFLAPMSYVQPFFDFGNVGDSLSGSFWQPRMDVGVRLKLGPVYADFPFWRYQAGGKGEFVFRWMLGLNLAGIGDF